MGLAAGLITLFCTSIYSVISCGIPRDTLCDALPTLVQFGSVQDRVLLPCLSVDGYCGVWWQHSGRGSMQRDREIRDARQIPSSSRHQTVRFSRISSGAPEVRASAYSYVQSGLAPLPSWTDHVQTLRHIYHHGSHDYPHLHRYLDIPPEHSRLEVTLDDGVSKEAAPAELHAKAISTNIQRMTDRSRSDVDRLLQYAALHGEAVSLPSSAWAVDTISGPNHTDKSTVLSLARMAANAYVTEPWTGDWEDVRGGFNYTDDFGWESDGLRGHIFADETNKTVVIGLKGTSMAVFDGAETTGHDKLNDNLFGSCCCGQGGQFLWKHVCDCMTDTYTCNSTCLVKSLAQKSHYYFAARDLYHNVTERYPGADVWMSGHSLGGVVSTLLGLTYGMPVMTFEAFPDAMAASRLGLPTPPGYHVGAHASRPDVAVHHYGHTADPVFMGTCNAASSLCTLAGYAFQGVCHTGKTCIYDTVQDLGWRVGVGTHRILSVIRDVLEKYDAVPACEEDVECTDCFNWKFFSQMAAK